MATSMAMNRMTYEGESTCSGPESSLQSLTQDVSANDLSGSARTHRLETRVNDAPSRYKFPVLISKSLKKSHVSRGFWLGLPTLFCENYMNQCTQETKVVLEDDDGKLWDTKYLPHGKGLSGGWGRFAKDHHLQVGNTVHFQFISTNRCKVSISKSTDSSIKAPPRVDKADGCHGKITTAKTGSEEAGFCLRRKRSRGREPDQVNVDRIKDCSKRIPEDGCDLDILYGYQNSQQRHWEQQGLKDELKKCFPIRRDLSDPEASACRQEALIPNQEEDSIAKERKILRSHSGGKTISDEDDHDFESAMVSERSNSKQITREETSHRPKESVQRSRKEGKSFEHRRFDINGSNEQHEDEHPDDRHRLMPRGLHHIAVQDVIAYTDEIEIDEPSRNPLEEPMLKTAFGNAGRRKPYAWSGADQPKRSGESHLTFGEEILKLSDRSKAPQPEETYNVRIDENSHPRPQEGNKCEEDTGTHLSVSAEDFAKDIGLLRALFNKQVMQVAEDLRTTMVSSYDNQRRDTQEWVQFQSSQQRDFFDQLVQKQHDILSRTLDQKIESQIMQLQHSFDNRLNILIKELQEFVEMAFDAGLDKRLK